MEFFQTRTDLAIEAQEIVQGKGVEKEVPGVKVSIEHKEDWELQVIRVEVIDEEGVKAIGKPIGTYITLESPLLKENDIDAHEAFIEIIGKELSELQELSDDGIVLVVGLGNWNVTPDALGPKVFSQLVITRHLLEYMPEQIDESLRSVSGILPGVLGITGMETGEIIQGVVDKIKPDLIIAIDALAARKASRVNTTIQMTNTGVQPGSGVGNKRMGLNEENLGIPVIAIGVPTVIDAATLVNDTMDQLLDTMKVEVKKTGPFYEMLENINKEEKYQLIREILDPYVGSLFVTPKDIDATVDRLAHIIAQGINRSLHPNLEAKDIDRYIH